ncbi:ATP adenylyltransferase [Malassezia brasiliensis]|uniref:ATP adenylyltransferase n=1 Tax=Malassezia brasiliensis TaxID=1821822 RepID=A0AAF0DPX5_9BASI|nr:ATP adenylyltransferase [Malassezia brasiliensis]
MPPYVVLRRANTTDDLVPTTDQRNTIIVACVYALAILLLVILYPFKLLTVGFHEFSHALMGVLTCAKIESIQLDPDEGGATRMRGGIHLLTLPAGYLGSSLIGAILIACGFDERASKTKLGSLCDISIAFFAGGILVGLVLFKTPVSEQKADDFLPRSKYMLRNGVRSLVQFNMSEIMNLNPIVSEKFKAAVDAGDAFFFDSTVHITGNQDKDRSPIASVPWQVRTVPALLKKPKANKEETKDDKPKQNEKDVFAPPYVPNLLVKEFTDFTVLLNKFCVLPKHFLMVTKGTVQSILKRNSTMAVPIENLLQHIERDGKEYSDVHLLPVPWQHFVVLLDPPREEAQLTTYLGHRFTQLLDCMFAAARDLSDIEGSGPRRGPPQFNILLTKRAMHLIPRRQEGFDLRTTDWAPYKDGEGPEHTGMLSVNALEGAEAPVGEGKKDNA